MATYQANIGGYLRAKLDNQIPGLQPALLQIRAETAEYRILYGEEVTGASGREAPIEPIVEWVKSRLR